MKSLPCLLTTSTLIISTQGFSQTAASTRTPLHASIPNTNRCTALSAYVTTGYESTQTISKLSKTISLTPSAELKALWSTEQDRRLQIRGRNGGRYGGRATSGASHFPSGEIKEDWGKILGFDMNMVSSSRRCDTVDIEHGGEGTGQKREKIRKIPTKVRHNSPIKKQTASNLFQNVLLKGGDKDQLANTLGIEFDSNGNIKELIDERDDNIIENENNGEMSGVLKSGVPAWFPYIPTKLQIESLKVTELREACVERNLKKVRFLFELCKFSSLGT